MSESRETELIEAIIENLDDSETEYTKTPQSRNEEILVSILNETEYTKTPQSREEELLLELKEKIGGLVPPVPPVIKRVTGNPIELTDAASAPLVKCVTEIQGSQDLHGYDKPWVGGAGKNKIDRDGFVMVVPANANITGTIGTIDCKSGVTYTFSCYQDNAIPTSTRNTLIATVNGGSLYESIETNYHTLAGRHELSFTPNSDQSVTLRYWSHTPSVDSTFSKFMLEVGSTATSYEPYSNICPITAYTEGEIEVRGKNLLPNGTVGGQYYSPEGNIITNAQIVSFPTILFTPGNYNMSLVDKTPTGTNSYIRMNELDENENFVSRLSTAQIHENTFKFSFSRNAYVQFAIDIYLENLMLVQGFTPSTYEPYTSTTHTTTYPSAIYRGSEDVVNGEVVDEWKKITISSGIELYGNYGDDNAPLFYFNVSTMDISAYASRSYPVENIPICNMYTAITSVSDTGMKDMEFRTRAQNPTNRFYCRDSRFTTAQDFNDYIAQNPIEIAYKLATPTTSSVSPTNLPIKSLSGYNHIESTTGEMQVDYITNQYQEFVNLTNAALPNTRKSGTKAMDIFLSLDNPKTPDQEKVDEIQNGVKEETVDDRR